MYIKWIYVFGWNDFPVQMCHWDIEKHVPDFPFFLIRESMTGMYAASHTLFVVLYSRDAYKKGKNERDIFLHLSS